MKMMMKVRVQPRRGLDYSCIRHPKNLHGVYACLRSHGTWFRSHRYWAKKRTKRGDGTKITAFVQLYNLLNFQLALG